MNSTAASGRSRRSASWSHCAVMLTLLPALLVICGRWIFWPAQPKYGADRPHRDGFWSRVGPAIADAPR